MSDKIEIGTRVKVTHNKARDSFWDDVERETRRLCDGQIGEVLRVSPLPPLTVFVQVGARRAWFGPSELIPIVTESDELTPVDDARFGDGAHLHSIVESAQALNRGAVHWQREASAAKDAIKGWVARCDALREEAERGNAARVEAERRENEAREDREALEARIQVAQVALDAVRLAAAGHLGAPFYDALDRLDRALRGVPAADRGRQGERFHAPATIEARLAEVERLVGSMSDHLAALDQRVAGLGNGLDEVRAGAQAPGEFDARPSGDR